MCVCLLIDEQLPPQHVMCLQHYYYTDIVVVYSDIKSSLCYKLISQLAGWLFWFSFCLQDKQKMLFHSIFTIFTKERLFLSSIVHTATQLQEVCWAPALSMGIYTYTWTRTATNFHHSYMYNSNHATSITHLSTPNITLLQKLFMLDLSTKQPYKLFHPSNFFGTKFSLH